MKYLTLVSSALLTFICIYNCTNTEKSSYPPPTNLSGQQLARNHCGSCHQFVVPDALTKQIWEMDVLPAMGHRLGIYEGGFRPDSLLGNNSDRETIKTASVFPELPLLANEDWRKIVDYYVSQAPDSITNRPYAQKIHQGLKHFTYTESPFSLRPPLTTMVKILPNRKGIVYADTKPLLNKLVFLDTDLTRRSELNFKTAPIDFLEKSDTLYITTIGKNPFPNDRLDGDVQKVFRAKPGQPYTESSVILPRLKRPVHVEYDDIDQDGLEDVLVCEFGNYTGKLSWFRKSRNGKYEQRILRNAPGAIHTAIHDMDQDGHKDILALMSQGQEGIFYYHNNNDDTFSERQLLSFSPLYGSQYFELCDFNQDGHLDIMYVCGDNADKTPILKDYHGIYIFENDGNMNFTQVWFFHQNGAYKAIPRDFDLDGDNDIASISFFPDYVDRLEESFIYLENTGELNFTPYSFPQATKGRWMVMDAGDLDGDGDLDLALGSFVYFKAMGDSTGLDDLWMTEGPSVIVLENTVR